MNKSIKNNEFKVYIGDRIYSVSNITIMGLREGKYNPDIRTWDNLKIRGLPTDFNIPSSGEIVVKYPYFKLQCKIVYKSVKPITNGMKFNHVFQ